MGAEKIQEKKLGTVILTRKDSFAIITFNRPEKLNALSPELMKDFMEALSEVAGDKAVRSIVVTGAGKSFSAGGDAEKDIAPLGAMSFEEFNAYFSEAMVMYKKIMDIEKPIIAAINGYALGGGLEIALSCDIRIAAEDAQLGEFYVRMGLCPESGFYLLPRFVGLGRAKLLSWTGDLVNAREAERIGLVDKVVPPDELMPAAEEMAKRLARGPKAIELIKKGFNESLGMTIDSSFDYAIQLQYQAVHTEDHKEALTAFLEKRRPTFKGK